jgi:hypothetical protein
MYDGLVHFPDAVMVSPPGHAEISLPGQVNVPTPQSSGTVYTFTQDSVMHTLPQSDSVMHPLPQPDAVVYTLPERTGGVVLNIWV